MILADVIVGNPSPQEIRTAATEKYKRPPQQIYDSVCGFTDDSRVYMIYAPRCRAFPSYVVTYVPVIDVS